MKKLCGARLDGAFRLVIPSAIREQVGEKVFIADPADGEHGLRIYFNFPEKIKKSFRVLPVKVERSKKQIRLSIPSSFRNSVSFFFGRQVALAYSGGWHFDFLELWPEPPNYKN